MQNDELSHVGIYMKLHRAKMHIGKVVKNATNPHFKKSYADINALLETVEPILHENGLILLQPIHDNVLLTQIIDIDSGQKVEIARYPGSTEDYFGNNILQKSNIASSFIIASCG